MGGCMFPKNLIIWGGVNSMGGYRERGTGNNVGGGIVMWGGIAALLQIIYPPILLTALLQIIYPPILLNFTSHFFVRILEH